MDILITGATGYIGGAVAEALQREGWRVYALARTRAGSEVIERSGWTAVPGDLRDTAGLEGMAGSFDAVIHAAHSGGADAPQVDADAARAFLRALRGSGRTFVYTSGAWVLGAGVTREDSAPNPAALVAWRASLEAEVLGAAPGVRAVVVRPGVVYGRGAGIPGMLARGELPIVGDGAQRWPLVHVDDLADLYVRALGSPAGSVLHGVSSSLSMRELALLGAAGRHAVPAQALPLGEARERFGTFADALALDQQVSSARTQELVGWRPRGPSPVEDLLIGSTNSPSMAAP